VPTTAIAAALEAHGERLALTDALPDGRGGSLAALCTEVADALRAAEWDRTRSALARLHNETAEGVADLTRIDADDEVIDSLAGILFQMAEAGSHVGLGSDD
jgi:hypothetical protein